MTVYSLQTARELLQEMGDEVVAIYQYRHAVTGQRLWSVETDRTRGSTLASQYVTEPRLVYDGEVKQWRA